MPDIKIAMVLIFSPSGRQMLLQEEIKTDGTTMFAPPEKIIAYSDGTITARGILYDLVGCENLDKLGKKGPGELAPINCGHMCYKYLDENGVFSKCTVTIFAHVVNPIGIVQPKHQMPLHWVPTWDYANAAPDDLIYDVSHGISTFVKTAAELIAPLRAASPVIWQPFGPKPYEGLASDYYMVRTGKRYYLPKRAVTAMKNHRISLGTAYAMTDEMWARIPGIGKTTRNQIQKFLRDTISVLHFPLDVGTGPDIDTKGGGENEPAETE